VLFPYDLIRGWPNYGVEKSDPVLLKPVQLLFQRGKRLFVTMGIFTEESGSGGLGYPDPAYASRALTDGMKSTSAVISTAMNSISAPTSASAWKPRASLEYADYKPDFDPVTGLPIIPDPVGTVIEVSTTGNATSTPTAPSRRRRRLVAEAARSGALAKRERHRLLQQVWGVSPLDEAFRYELFIIPDGP
jgi:hypothetical protein